MFAKCFSFNIKPILDFCHSINIKPQSFLSITELYSILNTFDHLNEIKTISQVAVNTRRYLNLFEFTPMCASTPIYIDLLINNSILIKDLMIEFNKKLFNNINNYILNHFKGLSLGELPLINPTSTISNIGKINISNENIWIQGGMYNIPEILKKFQSFTFHVLTCGEKLNIVFTYIKPGCKDETINLLISNFLNFLNNFENLINKPIF